jgi:hypothetical protein
MGILPQAAAGADGARQAKYRDREAGARGKLGSVVRIEEG